MPEKSVIQLSHHGSFLGTRHLGEVVRKEVLAGCNKGQVVVLDFSGVEGISHSFADESVGKLLMDLGDDAFRQRIRFVRVSEAVKPVLRYVTSARWQQIPH